MFCTIILFIFVFALYTTEYLLFIFMKTNKYIYIFSLFTLNLLHLPLFLMVREPFFKGSLTFSK